VSNIEYSGGVDIKALCDIVPAESRKVRKTELNPSALILSFIQAMPEAWKKLCRSG